MLAASLLSTALRSPALLSPALFSTAWPSPALPSPALSSPVPLSAPVSSATTPLPVPLAEHPGLWYPPLGPPLRIAEPYALPNGPYRAGHRGIDLPAAPDAAVHAPANGTVSFVGTVVDRPVLSIRIDARTVVSLEPITSELHEGDAVTRGEAIGTVGSGGHCGTACVHLGVRVGGTYVNPLRFLRARPVLLPW